ncbi:hypothetical protein [Aquitalea magnusonii]|uniref:Uncharacterized protein n=1 Tax=Aquitalea magnusonii TaxID=332411 RepID=A0A318J3I5_9NEIS|nr:hypothetical protein [Aquitalea magnusonii]PXX42213.1 hypothetical protein DFR38_12010 [Aquitalea magnusonii]
MATPKVTVHDKKVEATVAQASVDSVVDSKGRTLELREIGPLQESRIVLAVGADGAANQAYMLGYVMPAVLVAKIDGEHLVIPQTKLEVEAAITAVGREGLRAIHAHMEAKAKEQEEAEKAEKAAVKN